MSDDEGQDELVTEEMLWDRIPEVHGADRANTYYELSARIFARGQYDEALALAETARDIFSELGAAESSEGLAQAYSAIGYNLNQLKRMDEAATAMSKAVEILRESKSPLSLELACTLGEWWYASKNFAKVVEIMDECAQEHLVDGNQIGAANDLHLLGCAYRELKQYDQVARCDQKIASCYVELGDGEKAIEAARKAIDVFETGHDHRRETFALYEYGKAEVLLGKLDEGLSTLDGVLQIISEEEPKDFELIVDIETRMTKVLRALGRMDEADEIDRRLVAVREAMEDVPVSDDLGD